MTEHERLLDFVSSNLCKNNTEANAVAYDDDYHGSFMNVRVAFTRNIRHQYNKLLTFCAENSFTVISTHPATLETIVRVSTTR